MMRRALLAMMMTVGLAAPAWGDFQAGVEAYGRGDYATALQEWKPLAAEQGDATAQFNLGVMYANGQGVPQDYTRAHMWFNISASQGGGDTMKGRDILKNLMSPAQLEAAQKLARDCVEKNYKGC